MGKQGPGAWVCYECYIDASDDYELVASSKSILGGLCAWDKSHEIDPGEEIFKVWKP